MYKNFFFFDIETTTKSNTLFDLRLDDERGFDLFHRKYESMKTFDSSWNIPIDDAYVNKGAFLPEFGKIICLSFGMFTGDKMHIATIIEDDEAILMSRISHIFKKASDTKKFPICGFNIRMFDLPWIIKKMYKYDINIPSCLNYNGMKPWEINIMDLSEFWKGLGKSSSSLDEMTYELGIPSPKTIMKGEDVHDFYWVKQDKNSIVKHCEQDVDALIQLSEKLKL